VWGSHVFSSHTYCCCVVGTGFKVEKNPVKPSIFDATNILKDHPTGSHLLHESKHFGPQPPGIYFSLELSNVGDGLARRAAGDEIDGRWIVEGEYVRVDRDVWPPLTKYLLTERVSLAEGDGCEAGRLEAEGHAADAGKEVKDLHSKSIRRR
jgi:hypothetical protein